ncbi:MAG TPA: sigma-70 region 4 domain-containing protein, partial [Opitutaceae bacterium]
EGQTDALEAAITNENDVAPDDALAAKELIHKLLDQLNPEDRLVIQYLDLEQKSIAEISRLTGWNQTLVKVRAFRARRKLQRFYRELIEKERK